MDATPFIEKAYWTGFVRGALMGALLAWVGVLVMCHWADLKALWRLGREQGT